MHVSYVRGSVLLRHVYDRPHRLSPGRGFLPLTNALSAGKGYESAQRGRSMLATVALLRHAGAQQTNRPIHSNDYELLI